MNLKGSNSGMARISFYGNEEVFLVRCCFFPGLIKERVVSCEFLVHLTWQVLNSNGGCLNWELYMVLSQEQGGCLEPLCSLLPGSLRISFALLAC